MRLYSIIPQLDTITYDLEIADQFSHEAIVHREDLEIHRTDLVSIQIKKLFSAGFFIEEFRAKTTQMLSEEFDASGEHVRFLFYLHGSTSVQNGAGGQNYKHDVGTLLHNYLHNQGASGQMIIEPAEELNYLLVKMSRSFYLSITAGESWIMNDNFHQYILSGLVENRPNESYAIDLHMLKIFEEIFHGTKRFSINTYIYVVLKLKELLFLVHQSRNYANVNQIEAPFRETLLKVKAYLEMNLENPPNAQELAAHFKYNEKNLKRDFKQYFGTSIYAFIVRNRMEVARSLLGNNYNVNELSIRLGYRSVSHFIKVFRKHHGYTPHELLKFEAINNSRK